MHVHWVLHSHATMRRITHGTSKTRLHYKITLWGPRMTARHVRDERLDRARQATSEHGGGGSIPIPEAVDLPPQVSTALQVLIGAGPPPEAAGLAAPVTFPVDPEPESVTAARHFALIHLAECGLAELAEDVGLVVSELVTNALRHGVPPCAPAPARSTAPAADPVRFLPAGAAEPGDRAGALVLRMVCRFPWALCGVTDPCPAGPRRREPDYIAETGRGLHLVESFSARWGWNGLPTRSQASEPDKKDKTGKVVWALFQLP